MNELDNRTELEETLDLFNDLFKDLNGFRPRWIYSEGWTLEHAKAEVDRISAELTAEIEREEKLERELAAKFGIDVPTYRRWEREAMELR